jgi:hypothetical protein
VVVAGGFTYTVAADVSTVTVTHAGASDTAVNTLINSITFDSTSDDPGASRTVNLGDIDDTGTAGTLNPNVDATINITEVGDAPAGTDNTVTATEDIDYVFQTADFGFTDPLDDPDDSFASVIITTTTTKGALYVDANSDGVVDAGEEVVDSETVTAADIAAGRLKFKPVADANGDAYDTFTFQVVDDGGGEDTDLAANIMTIDVTSVGDAPAGADNTVTTDEDTDYVFQTADFGFSDPLDDPDDSFDSVIIVSTVSNGTLYVDADGDGVVDGGETINDSDSVTAADIAAGRLKFKPVANANGDAYDSFTFQVTDDGGGADTDATANIMIIDVTSVGDAPAGADNTVTTDEDTDYVFQTADFGFSDPIDNPDDSFASVVIFTTVSNGTLYVDADGDGVVDAGETINDSDTVAVADITAGRLKFKPVADANGDAYDTFTFQVKDDGGGADTDATANIMIIDVTAVDDVPAVDAGLRFNLAENAAKSVSVGTVTAIDGDPGTTFQNWTIVSGNGDGIFQINANTGEITVADNTNLDFEITASYTLGITVSDGINTSPAQNVTINITDVGEAPATLPEDPVTEPGDTPSDNDDEEDAGSGPIAPPTDNFLFTNPGEGNGSEGLIGQLGASNPMPQIQKANDPKKELENQNPDAWGVARPERTVKKKKSDSYHILTDRIASGLINPLPVQVNDKIWDHLDLLKGQMQAAERSAFIAAAAVLGLSVMASAGYVIWAVRGVSLMSSFLSSVPIWRFIDPLPILGAPGARGWVFFSKKEKDEEDVDKDEEKIGQLFD